MLYLSIQCPNPNKKLMESLRGTVDFTICNTAPSVPFEGIVGGFGSALNQWSSLVLLGGSSIILSFRQFSVSLPLVLGICISIPGDLLIITLLISRTSHGSATLLVAVCGRWWLVMWCSLASYTTTTQVNYPKQEVCWLTRHRNSLKPTTSRTLHPAYAKHPNRYAASLGSSSSTCSGRFNSAPTALALQGLMLGFAERSCEAANCSMSLS
jgi:hypothetical protein